MAEAQGCRFATPGTDPATRNSPAASLLQSLAETQTALGRQKLCLWSNADCKLLWKLEQERIRTEMRTSFAGASQDLAIRVQGFKDYLTGSLGFGSSSRTTGTSTKGERRTNKVVNSPNQAPSSTPQFAEPRFQSTKKIRLLIDQYRTKPDYYGPPQLRRTFEPPRRASF